MKVRIYESGGEVVLALSGELDHHAAKELIREMDSLLEEYPGTACVLDLREVSFMDSSGIAVVLGLYRRMNEVGGALKLRNVPEQAGKVLHAAGLQRLIPFE